MKKRTFFTADTHFFHGNIIRYSGRPFRDITEMNEALVRNWNETVGEEDIVYHLGDFAFGRSVGHKSIFERLNGSKILVVGNHDRSKTRMLQIGFDQVIDEMLMTLAPDLVVRLCHLPYIEEEGYSGYQPVDDGKFLLCGHVHNQWKISGRQINVGVDQWGYRPVEDVEIIRLIEEMEGE